jgi:ribonuclease T1
VFSVGLPSGQGSKSGSTRQAVRKLTLALWVSGGMLLSASAFARNSDKPADAAAGMPTVALVTLPAQAQTTYRLILGAGPFPYDKDGTVFGNRERLLPQAPRGHYREYTVKTPGLSHRGARRIVCGGKPPSQPEACFYTDDHYASFRLIAK